MKVLKFFVLSIGLILTFTQVALADKTWTGTNLGLWSDGDNWNPVGVPEAGENVLINNGNNVLLDIGYSTGDRLNDLIIDVNSTLQQNSNVTLSDTNAFVGATGAGTYSQSAGQHIVGWNDVQEKALGWLFVGDHENAIGNYSLSGTGSIESGMIMLGRDGEGHFTQDGPGSSVLLNGELSMGGNSFLPATSSTSYGEYTLNDGSLHTISVYDSEIGYSGTGMFNQNGGTFLSENSLSIAVLTGSVGSYHLVDGILAASNEFVGGAGMGSIYQLGGANYIGYDLYGAPLTEGPDYELIIGRSSGGSGIYELYAGTLMANRELVGDAGARGVFRQLTGSIHEVANDLIIGQDAYAGVGRGGTFSLYDTAQLTVNGNMFIGDEGGNGLFEQSGGNAVVNGVVAIGVNSESGSDLPSSGMYTQTGGNLHVNGGDEIWQSPYDPDWKEYVGLALGVDHGTNGTYNLDSGSLNVTNATIVGNYGHGEFFLGYYDDELEQYLGDGIHNTGMLYVGYNTGYDTSRYYLNSGTLHVTGFTVIGGKDYGPAGYGEFTQNGGAFTTAGVFLGDTVDSYGAYYLNDGSLTVNGWESIGGQGEAYFEQIGGIHVVNGSGVMKIGSSSYGTYSMDGGELLVHTNYETDHIGLILGESAFANFYQSGGSVTVDNNLYQGYQPSGSGYYVLYNNHPENLSSLYVGGNHLIGWNGFGSFEIAQGGSHHVGGDLNLAQAEASQGQYYMDGGTLQVDGTANIGHDGFGQFTLYAGDVDVGGLVLGNELTGRGDFLMYGGRLDSSNEIIGRLGKGTFLQYSGTNTVNGDLYIDLAADSGALPANINSIEDLIEMSYSQYGLWEDGVAFLEAGRVVVGGSFAEGLDGTGIFTQSGGVVNTDALVLGDTEASTGVYFLENGTLNAGLFDGGLAESELIGYRGTGYFYQTGGLNSALSSMYVGVGQVTGLDGEGKYYLRGGEVDVAQNFIVGHYPGSTGDFYMNWDLTGTITQLLVGGNISVGNVGTGTFTQDAGLVRALGTVEPVAGLGKGQVVVGYDPGSVGTYTMNGGNLYAFTSMTVGKDGAGEFIQNAGVVEIGDLGTRTEENQLYVKSGAGSGSYDMRGGEIYAHGVTNNDVFNYRGGEIYANFYNNAAGRVTFAASAPADTLTLHESSTNDGQWQILNSNAEFVGPVSNRVGATMHVTNSAVAFDSTFTNDGAFVSDPSVMDFYGDATIGATGYIAASAGDIYNFHAGFFSSSTSGSWNTTGATLAFIGGGEHALQLVSSPSLAWDKLWLAGGALINFAGTGNLHVNTIVVPNSDLSQLFNVDQDLNVFFMNIQTPNALGGFDTVSFTQGQLPSNMKVVPEPISSVLFLVGAGVFGAAARKRRKV